MGRNVSAPSIYIFPWAVPTIMTPVGGKLILCKGYARYHLQGSPGNLALSMTSHWYTSPALVPVYKTVREEDEIGHT